MKNVLETSLKNMAWTRNIKKRFSRALKLLSLLVILNVFWFMKQPGLTLVGDASCGYIEHRHDEECNTGTLECQITEEMHIHNESCYKEIRTCELDEHVHSLDCYSDETADVETPLDWQKMFEDFPYSGDIREDLVGIAKTQVGYSESERNYEVGRDGVRRGYTRYGAWYGTPYRDWSAMFVSYCLNYAGADPEENPGNTGASAMAKQWKKLGKYTTDEDYQVISGDLVFFKDNTVGIVTDVYSTTFQVIHGDADDEVREDLFALSDECIKGWGITGGGVQDIEEEMDQDAPVEKRPEKEPIKQQATPSNAMKEESMEEDPPRLPSAVLENDLLQEEQISTPSDALKDVILQDSISQDKMELDEEELLDISSGPVFFIFEGEKTDTQKNAQKRNVYFLQSPRTTKDLLDYLKKNEGSYIFTLLDNQNKVVPTDDNGNYLVKPNTKYKLTISFVSPKGFPPGTYQYQVPNGLMVEGGDGEFILQDETNVGSWDVTDTGLITLVFNENINNRTDITISSTIGIHFPEQDDIIDFDGQIKVSVEKPPQQLYPTQMNKWGNQGGTEGSKGDDDSKIYWGLEIIGNKDSKITDNILTDKIIHGEWSKKHRFTQSDIEAGLSFGVSENGNWHEWQVTSDDPHLIWTETGWSYKMPQTATCNGCGEIELGNEGWTYYIHYTSTPDKVGVAGSYGYENEAKIDGAYGYSWVNFTQGDASGEIKKTGSFISDSGGGAFLWEFQALIPGRKEGKRADYHWYITDRMNLLDSNGDSAGLVENDAHLAMVTATYNDVTIEVPRIQDATSEDIFAWDNAYTATENGINYSREFNILSRCQCTTDTCHWENGCGEYWFVKDDGTTDKKGFCQCWTAMDDVIFTFVYKTKDMSLIEKYGGLGYKIHNNVELFYIPEGETGGASVDRSDANVPIPGLFKKELTQDFDGYTANYKITVNESKVALTNGSPLHIHDEMTDTLAYISGSLVITSEDADGNIEILKPDNDYTITYDGSGNKTDSNGQEVHILDVVIKHPQPVMYTLDYDATLIMPEQVTGGIKYSNSATITLWGNSITDESDEKVYADFNISAKSYKVMISKTSGTTGEPLEGALFGLYNHQGSLITTGITDADGELLFQTNVTEGIVLREHVLYYIQEVAAPPGYQTDDTEYWFCFCNKIMESCEKCQEITNGMNVLRIPYEQIGTVDVTNQPVCYELPSTGGLGIYPIAFVSVMFIVTPLIYGFILKRKKERRT